MKYLLLMLLSAGCSPDIKTKSEKRDFINTNNKTELGIKEICIDRVVYYYVHMLGYNGGPILTPKLTIQDGTKRPVLEACRE